ncbi:MAG: riboflavin synthase [Planctomycetota bacterium]
MFTGIVERACLVTALERTSDGCRLRLEARPRTVLEGDLEPWRDLETGESIAVNGVCLTLVGERPAAGPDPGELAFDVIEESLRASALGDLKPGMGVNLERALRVGDRFGGHYVTGHVDAIGRVAAWERDRGETILRIAVEERRGFQVIPKGSVTIEGVSLTITEAGAEEFAVALIPHTLEVTNLAERSVGDRVNLEMDHIGKWVEHLLAPIAGAWKPGGERQGEAGGRGGR